jgi:hypothetical protein
MINNEEVVLKAFLRVCSLLNIDNDTQVKITSTTEENGDPRLIFLEIFKLVYLIGNDDAFVKHWFVTENNAFGEAPIEMCKSSDGLITVLDYLNKMTRRR